jgi:hypothetical protein
MVSKVTTAVSLVDLLKDAEGVIETVVLGDSLVTENNRRNRKGEFSKQGSRRLRSLGRKKTLLDDDTSDTSRSKVLLSAEKDDGEVLHRHSP